MHRYIGLTVAFFAILLSTTGILLNHTEELGLNKHNVSASWLMKLYGIKTPEITRAFSLSPHDVESKVKNSWVVEFAGNIYYNNQKLECPTPLEGAIETDDILLIASRENICLFTRRTELIDILSLPETSPPNKIKRLGIKNRLQIILNTSAETLTINDEYTELIPYVENTDTTKWITQSAAPETIQTDLIKKHQGSGLPLERIILDLHSGRILGNAGVYFMDLVAVLLIFLAISGLITWISRKKIKKV